MSDTTASQSAIALCVPRTKPCLIPILNALPGQARNTSPRNARRLVRHGMAIAKPDGIILLPVEQIRRLEALCALDQADDRMIQERGGVLWWNGCDHHPNAAHRPGENVFLPRTDRARAYYACLEER